MYNLDIKTSKCCEAILDEPSEEELILMGDNHPSLYGLATCPTCHKECEIDVEYI